VDLKDAAKILDTTTEAVRKRAKRGTLLSTTGEYGRLYVRVDGQVDDRVDARVDGEPAWWSAWRARSTTYANSLRKSGRPQPGE
jgi:hypothetical protein